MNENQNNAPHHETHNKQRVCVRVLIGQRARWEGLSLAVASDRSSLTCRDSAAVGADFDAGLLSLLQATRKGRYDTLQCVWFVV